MEQIIIAALKKKFKGLYVGFSLTRQIAGIHVFGPSYVITKEGKLQITLHNVYFENETPQIVILEEGIDFTLPTIKTPFNKKKKGE